ncbi:hypothetical protein F4814DRAFT_449324 [Daldinia grandis]|nr:hypothetical protein F4814DRAFT_449324 [Daldinia grandis]
MSPLHSHCKQIAYFNSLEEKYDGDFTTVCYSHESSPVLTSSASADHRWKCCNCAAGGNNSIIYNNACLECGHVKCSDCCPWTSK